MGQTSLRVWISLQPGLDAAVMNRPVDLLPDVLTLIQLVSSVFHMFTHFRSGAKYPEVELIKSLGQLPSHQWMP